MPITITCPACRTTMKGPDTAAGKRIRCPKCAATFGVSAPAAALPAASGNEIQSPPAAKGDRRPAPRMLLDALVAIASAAGFTLMLMKSTQQPFDDRLAAFFNQHSKLIAHGENVVNVIIVGHRAAQIAGFQGAG